MRKLSAVTLLAIIATANIACSAANKPESNAGVDQQALVKFVKNNVVKNRDVKVLGIDIVEEKTVPELPGWNVVMLTMNLEYQGQRVKAPETFFIKDGIIAPVLIDLKSNTNYKEVIKPTVPQSAYNKEHLVAGNENAKHKILVFSDPMCPFCQEIVPDLLKSATLSPDDIAVYYYHLPLAQIHPVSPALTQIMHIAGSQGKNDMIAKIYALKISPSETNPAVIAKAVKAQTGFVVTPAQMSEPTVLAALKADEDMAAKLMVSGTPTIFIDGKLDKMREGYKTLVTKK